MSGRVRLLLFVAWLPAAYAGGWIADAVLNDDPCAGLAVPETSALEPEAHWFPARTDCRVTFPEGRSRLVRGDASVFLAAFGFWLAISALVLVPGGRWGLRAALAAGALLVAFAVTFGFL